MAVVYTQRFGPASLYVGNTDQTVYTVPSGKVAVVRNVLVVTNTRTTTRALALAIGTTATRSNRWFDESVLATRMFETRLTVYAGEEIHAVSDAVDALSLHITGYLFDA